MEIKHGFAFSVTGLEPASQMESEWLVLPFAWPFTGRKYFVVPTPGLKLLLKIFNNFVNFF